MEVAARERRPGNSGLLVAEGKTQSGCQSGRGNEVCGSWLEEWRVWIGFSTGGFGRYVRVVQISYKSDQNWRSW